MIGVKISYITYHFPSINISNRILAKQFPQFSEEQILKKTGVENRYQTREGEVASDLAVKAAEKLFLDNGFRKDEVGFLLFVTEAADYIAPVTACILQDRLNLPANIGALDIPGGCAGFTNALGVAKSLIMSGQTKNVLILLADIPSSGIHPEDFALKGLFSDAASALFVESCEKNGVGNFVYGTDGSGAKSLFVERSGFRNPIDKKWLEENKEVGGMPIGRMKMNGMEVLSFSLQRVPTLVDDILNKNQLKFEEIDLFVFHQASEIILKSIQKKLKIPDEKMVYCLLNNGNTVSVSIPLAIQKMKEEGRIFKGTKVLIAGYGIGFSWSGTVLYF